MDGGARMGYPCCRMSGGFHHHIDVIGSDEGPAIIDKACASARCPNLPLRRYLWPAAGSRSAITDIAEFIHNDRKALLVIFGQGAVGQSGFTAAEKARQKGDWYWICHCLCHASILS